MINGDWGKSDNQTILTLRSDPVTNLLHICLERLIDDKYFVKKCHNQHFWMTSLELLLSNSFPGKTASKTKKIKSKAGL